MKKLDYIKALEAIKLAICELIGAMTVEVYKDATNKDGEEASQNSKNRFLS